MKLYLDTNIWIDFLDEKRENHLKAVALFEKIKEKNYIIVVTRLHSTEAGALYRKEYNLLKDKMYKQGLCFGIRDTEVDREIAYKHDQHLKKGYFDCLHLQIARRIKAKPVSSDEHWQEIAEAYGIRVYKYEELNL